MISEPLKAYLLVHAEVEADTAMPRLATEAMHSAELVVAMSAFKHRALDYAQVLLPIAPFTETAGTFVNIEGRAQSFNGVVAPRGQARPAWKVLRVLGNLLQLDGFGYESIEEVRNELGLQTGEIQNRLGNEAAADQQILSRRDGAGAQANTLERIGEVPIYHTDGIVRRAHSLQLTRDAHVDSVWMNASMIERLGLRQGDRVRVAQDGGEAILICQRDDRLPDDCVRVAAATEATMQLGAAYGALQVERLSTSAEVSS
jgi:NADH-quinone oxidoreductase subunit G